MQPLTAAQIRERFLTFFEERGHQRMPSDSLVPANDPTLLFTGAGMNQFKDMFLGRGSLPDKRVTTSQKCLRVPDLDEVGRTPRHHTFFEMLGNFSFGDYFKTECIPWEWEFFTRALSIPEEQLVVTVYEDDDEAFEIWHSLVGLAAEKIYRFGEKENFWPAEAPSKGPDGPCGPCSEIYFDDRPSEPYPDPKGLMDLPGERFTEIGNCVFTQFDRQPDGSLKPLPQRNIDVGLGLERITAVLAGAPTNFDTDLFQPYLRYLQERSGRKYGKELADDQRMRRVADHARAVTFCIADGAVPSNEGRGYVVRKILRRAVRDGYDLGIDAAFLFEMVDLVGEVMGDAYPEVRENAGQCRSLIRSEEEGFATVYRQGMQRLERFLQKAKGSDSSRGDVPGTGSFAFELHDTYGFPVDISDRVMADAGIRLDHAEFELEMGAQRDRARAATTTADAVFAENAATKLRGGGVPQTKFTGYDGLSCKARVLALLDESNELVPQAAAGCKAQLVVDQTPFYAEGGGQVGDCGTVAGDSVGVRIDDTLAQGDYHLHRATVQAGILAVGDMVTLSVDKDAREATERNHTATHLLHAALKQILGSNVSQAGSVVEPARLRFDFTYGEKLTDEQIASIEELVSRNIMAATPVQSKVRSMQEARDQGYVALFGEKYGDEVRTLAVGEFSKELCGGTHVGNSGAIGGFRIVSEGAISAGTRRIEAVTGFGALTAAQRERSALANLAQALKTPVEEVPERVQTLLDESKKLRKELEKALAADVGKIAAELASTVVEGAAGRSLVAKVEDLSMKDLQDLLGRVQKQYGPLACVLLAPAGKGKEVLVGATVAKELVGRVQAGATVQALAKLLGGGGGGRPEMAQGKGRDAARLPEALAEAVRILKEADLAPA